jgi:LPS sulfotransferase NodH
LNRFVILSTPRSGTNYFCSKLALIPKVLLAWEPFNEGVEEWFDSSDTFLSLPESVRLQLTDVSFRNTNPQGFFERSFGHGSTLDLSTVSALGFKLFPQHNPRLFWRCCADSELKVIVLERENRFASYASYVNVVSDEDYIKATFGARSPDLTSSPVFSPAAFEMYKDFVDTVFAGINTYMRNVGKDYLHLTYPHLVNNEAIFRKVCEFIGVDYLKQESKLQKEITGSACNIFTNPQEAHEYISRRYPQFMSPEGDLDRRGLGSVAASDRA